MTELMLVVPAVVGLKQSCLPLSRSWSVVVRLLFLLLRAQCNPRFIEAEVQKTLLVLLVLAPLRDALKQQS
ncbi:hypothetical protein B0H19DRAFT_1167522 [Mycena capillaripes]|nr:hypothetical protein B0H19DRAFT_1167522 [Mycena capillaripes]